jgi:hypothetical protein
VLFLDWFAAVPPKAQTMPRLGAETTPDIYFRRPKPILRDGVYELRWGFGINYRIFFLPGRPLLYHTESSRAAGAAKEMRPAL